MTDVQATTQDKNGMLVLTLNPSTLNLERKTEGVGGINRYDYTKLWSVQIGDFSMPLSQEFTLRARKRLNVSSLVDGIDIIQQTRKEAKTIDCSMRLTLRNDRRNLSMEKQGSNANEVDAMTTFANFLQTFYENDEILEIKNKTINEVFGVQHVFISEYKFIPRKGSTSFQFDFALTEVIYGNDVLTLTVNEMI